MNRHSGFATRDSGGKPISDSEARIFYLIQTQADIPANDDWLSAEERKIRDSFRFPKRRNDWLLGRWTAKKAIVSWDTSNYPCISLLEIRAAQDGAPETYYQGAPASIAISLTHSRDRALCALAPDGDGVGCDLEWMEPREASFAEDYFTQEEWAWVLRFPEKRELLETLIWSAKEATLKILRQGLTRDTRSVQIRADIGEEQDCWSRWTGECVESSRFFHGWWRAAEGFVCTIASISHLAFPPRLLF